MTQGFEFSEFHEARYDPAEIADKAVWPALQEKWGRDWRVASTPTMPDFSYPMPGVYDNRWLEVTLSAGCYYDYLTEGEGENAVETLTMDRDVEILIEESASHILLDLVAAAKEELEKESAEREDGEEDALLVHLNDLEAAGELESELRAVNGFIYQFDSRGGFSARIVQALQDPEGQDYWSRLVAKTPASDGEDGDYDDGDGEDALEIEFGAADVDNLRAAMAVLGVSADIIDYLDGIRLTADQQ